MKQSKHFILAVIILHLFVSSANAQWSLNGNIVTDSSKLGSLNQKPVHFIVGNKERMRLSTDTILAIYGAKALGIDNKASFSAKNSSGVYEEFMWPRWSDNSMQFRYGSGGFYLYNHLNRSVMHVDVDGKVGIGTNTPTSLLSVNKATGGPATADFRNTSIGPNISWIHFGPKGDWQIRSAANDGNVILQDQSTSGKVGIGTTRPFRKLEVRDGDIRIKTTDARRFLEFLDDAPDHTDYRIDYYPVPGDEFKSTYLYVNSSNDNFNSNIVHLAQFASPSYGYVFTIFGSGLAAGGIWQDSDVKLKQNINNLGSALDIIKRLQPKTYFFKKAGYENLNLPSKQQYGFIAQDLEKVLPELVSTSKQPVRMDAKGESQMEEIKAVNYTALIPLLTKAIQEQQKEIDELKQMVEKLSTQSVNNNTSAEVSKSTNVIVSNATLEQNKPNPFASATTIQYYVPVGAQRAQLAIYDSNGKIVKQVSLNAGKGTVNIDASNLSNGTYRYSIVIDNKTIESKTMIVAH
jgi:hypothetical protein